MAKLSYCIAFPLTTSAIVALTGDEAAEAPRPGISRDDLAQLREKMRYAPMTPELQALMSRIERNAG